MFYVVFFLIWRTPVLFFQFTYWERKVEKIILYNKVHLLHVKMLKLSCLLGTIIYCVICQNPRFVFINRNTINAHKTGCHKLIVVDPKRQRWYGLFRNRQLMRKTQIPRYVNARTKETRYNNVCGLSVIVFQGVEIIRVKSAQGTSSCQLGGRV